MKKTNVNYISVVTPAPSVFFDWATPKENCPIKPVRDVFSVNPSPAPPVTNVINAVEGLAVGARLQKIWQVWAQKGSSPRVVSILKEGVQPSVQGQTSSHQGSSDKEWTCQSLQEQLPEGGIVFPPSKASCVKGQNTIRSGILQSTFHFPKTKPKMTTNFGPQYLKLVPQGQYFQNGNTRVHSTVPSTGEWVTSLEYFHIPISPNSRKFIRFHYQDQKFQFWALPFISLWFPWSSPLLSRRSNS